MYTRHIQSDVDCTRHTMSQYADRRRDAQRRLEAYQRDYILRVKGATLSQDQENKNNNILNLILLESDEYKERVRIYEANNPMSDAIQKHTEFVLNKERYDVLTMPEQARWTKEQVYLLQQDDIRLWVSSAKCVPKGDAQRMRPFKKIKV